MVSPIDNYDAVVAREADEWRRATSTTAWMRGVVNVVFAPAVVWDELARQQGYLWALRMMVENSRNESRRSEVFLTGALESGRYMPSWWRLALNELPITDMVHCNRMLADIDAMVKATSFRLDLEYDRAHYRSIEMAMAPSVPLDSFTYGGVSQLGRPSAEEVEVKADDEVPSLPSVPTDEEASSFAVDSTALDRPAQVDDMGGGGGLRSFSETGR